MAIEAILDVESVERYPLIPILIGIQITFYLTEQMLTYLQMTSANIKERPAEIKALGFTTKEFIVSQVYSFDKLVFDSMTAGFSTAIWLILYLSSAYPFLWEKIPVFFPFIDATSEFQVALTFLLVTSVFDQIMDIPFSVFKTFKLEERYGFNKTTVKTFIMDIFKSNLVSTLLTAFLLYCYLKVVEIGGKYFYIYGLIFSLLVILLMMLLYPNVIAPLFNKYEELEEGELKTGIEKLATANNFPLKKLFKVDGSTRSSHSNAYFFGFGKNKRIVLFDTLINQLSLNEIYAVLCHEIGHWQFSHTFKNLALVLTRILAFFYLFSFVIYSDSFYVSFGYSQKSIFVGTFLFMQLFVPFNKLMDVLSKSMSRIFEHQADEYAYKMGYADSLQTGLIKMFKENAGNLLPHPLYSWYHFSHPPLRERLEALKVLQNKKK